MKNFLRFSLALLLTWVSLSTSGCSLLIRDDPWWAISKGDGELVFRAPDGRPTAHAQLAHPDSIFLAATGLLKTYKVDDSTLGCAVALTITLVNRATNKCTAKLEGKRIRVEIDGNQLKFRKSPWPRWFWSFSNPPNSISASQGKGAQFLAEYHGEYRHSRVAGQKYNPAIRITIADALTLDKRVLTLDSLTATMEKPIEISFYD